MSVNDCDSDGLDDDESARGDDGNVDGVCNGNSDGLNNGNINGDADGLDDLHGSLDGDADHGELIGINPIKIQKF